MSWYGEYYFNFPNFLGQVRDSLFILLFFKRFQGISKELKV